MNQADINQAEGSRAMRESLSAGIDGELSKEQLRFLLRRLEHDASLLQAWDDFHVARDGLRRELPMMATPGFAARVRMAIDQESVSPVTASRRNHWLRWSAGGAIAASVAAAALMIAQPMGDAERHSTQASRQISSSSNTVAVNSAPAPAAVPPWLSGNSAGMLSQRASVTLGAPFSHEAYARSPDGYQSMPRYRTLDNNDGSYLLLLDPEHPFMPSSARQQVAVPH